MSEHEQLGHGEEHHEQHHQHQERTHEHRESWNKELVHGLHELKEALEHRGSREHEYEREVRHVFETIVVPVLAQFKEDAAADQMKCSLDSPSNSPNARCLTLQRTEPRSQPFFQVTFEWTASPLGYTLRARRGVVVHDFLKEKKLSEVSHKDVADYLAQIVQELVKAEKVS